MERHLYRRTIGVSEGGKPVRAWYFWYVDPVSKKKVRKSCGTFKKPVLLKTEAKSIIDRLAEKDRDYLAIRGGVESVTIKDMADSMFHEASAYLKRRREQGYIKDETTLRDIQGYLNNFILKRYGHLKPEDIDPVIVDRDLIGYKDEKGIGRSNSWRNRIVSILNFILDEAIWLKMIKYKPILLTYKKQKGKKSILSREEMTALFPADFDALAKVWDAKGTVSEDGFMFGAMFALITSTGLRNGEARAVSPYQLILTDGVNIAKMVGADGREAANPLGKTKRKIAYGLIIDRMFNQSGNIVAHLKKGSDEDPKLRVAVIPEKTVLYLKHWLSVRPLADKNLLFTFKGRRIRREYLEYRLNIGVKNAKINMGKGRILTPHSLRFTYNTKMSRKIPGKILRPMMGHETADMTDYYTITTLGELNEQFIELRDSAQAIDGFWGKK